MKLSITEIELNRVIAALAPRDAGLDKLNARLTRDGLTVTGEYQMMLAMAFRTEWELKPLGGGVEAHLKNLHVAGFSASKLRGLLLKLLRDAINEPGRVHVEGERVRVDVPAIVEAHKHRIRPEVTMIQCLDGALEVEVVLRPA